MNNINRTKFPCKLLVEGKDDLFVAAAIRDQNQLPDNFEIIDCKGVENIPDQLTAHINLRRPKIEAIGIILDADANINGRWESLKNILQTESYMVPIKPDIDGTVIAGTGRNPTIGIWLMPDNLQSGMLEDFVKLLIGPDDQLSPFVEEILSKIEEQDIPTSYNKDVHHAKAFIHTWLAWQEEPGRPMGTAITATYLNHNADLCLRFVAWLNRLFNPQ